MKINVKTAWVMIIFTLIYMGVSLQHVALRMNKQLLTNGQIVIQEIVYIIPIIYIVTALKHLKEERSIVITYRVYLFFDIIYALLSLFMPKIPGYKNIFFVLTLLSILITQIMSIQSFRIKTKQIIVSYCIYSITFFLLIFIKLIGNIMIMLYGREALFNYTIPFEMLSPITIFYMLFSILKYLKTEQPTLETGLTIIED